MARFTSDHGKCRKHFAYANESVAQRLKEGGNTQVRRVLFVRIRNTRCYPVFHVIMSVAITTGMWLEHMLSICPCPHTISMQTSVTARASRFSCFTAQGTPTTTPCNPREWLYQYAAHVVHPHVRPQRARKVHSLKVPGLLVTVCDRV